MYVAIGERHGTVFDAGAHHHPRSQECLARLVYRPPLRDGVYALTQDDGLVMAAPIDPYFSRNAVTVGLRGPAWRLARPYHWEMVERPNPHDADRLVLYVDREVELSIPETYLRSAPAIRLDEAELRRLSRESMRARQLTEATFIRTLGGPLVDEAGATLADMLSGNRDHPYALPDWEERRLTRDLLVQVVRVQDQNELPNPAGIGGGAAFPYEPLLRSSTSRTEAFSADTIRRDHVTRTVVAERDTAGSLRITEERTENNTVAGSRAAARAMLTLEYLDPQRPGGFGYQFTRDQRGNHLLRLVVADENMRVRIKAGSSLRGEPSWFEAFDVEVVFAPLLVVPRPQEPFTAPLPLVPLAAAVARWPQRFLVEDEPGQEVVMARMSIDVSIGLIPVVGDIADVGELVVALLTGRDRWGEPVPAGELVVMAVLSATPFVTNSLRQARRLARDQSLAQSVRTRLVTVGNATRRLEALAQVRGVSLQRMRAHGRFATIPDFLLPPPGQHEISHLVTLTGLRPNIRSLLDRPPRTRRQGRTIIDERLG